MKGCRVSSRGGLLRLRSWSLPTGTTSNQHVSISTTTQTGSREIVSPVEHETDRLDIHLEGLASQFRHNSVCVNTLYEQYQFKAGKVIGRTVPYEERPKASKWTHTMHHNDGSEGQDGDGLVLVVHVCLEGEKALRTAVCSGFVVDASIGEASHGDVVVTCAHTLADMARYLKREATTSAISFSFIVPSHGPPRAVTNLLSSMPRSDVVLLEARPSGSVRRLRAVPLTPFPVQSGTPILTHLFGSPEPPSVRHSVARTKARSSLHNASELEKPIPWIDNHAWRRWGAGIMLGYRSYTGLELEAGINSVLPHILTSILPTSGSSGGPLVNGETGCVVGMISGRRMDNYVEGERGWGCSSEGIFEMFSLPGFMPTMK